MDGEGNGFQGMSDLESVQLVQGLQQQMEFQKTVTHFTNQCWDKCISDPGTPISNRQKECMKDCSSRYADTLKLVVRKVMSDNNTTSQGFYISRVLTVGSIKKKQKTTNARCATTKHPQQINEERTQLEDFDMLVELTPPASDREAGKVCPPLRRSLGGEGQRMQGSNRTTRHRSVRS
eukprot:g71504.t1